MHSIEEVSANLATAIGIRCLQKVSSFEIIMLVVYRPTLGFDTKQRNSFLIKFGVFFYNKSKILTILFIIKYEKITHFVVFLVLLGPIISRFFACSNEEKINQNNKDCLL